MGGGQQLTQRRKSRASSGASPRISLTFDCDEGGLAFAVCVPPQPAARDQPQPKCSPNADDTSRQHDATLAVGAEGSCSGLAAVLLRRLRARPEVVQQLQQGGEPLNSAAVVRWLRSRNWELDAAEEAIAQHAAWRSSYFPKGRIAEADISNELAANKVFLQGHDHQGHAVVVVMARRHDGSARELAETERLICYTLDNSLEACDLQRNQLGKICCLFDLSGLSLRNLDVKSLGKVFELLQRHYPERLASLWFLNAPLIFWGVWNCVAPFVDPATRRKIHFASASPSSTPAALANAVPRAVLPAPYGGAAALAPIQHAVQAMQQRRQECALHAATQREEPEAPPSHDVPWWARARSAVGRAARGAGGFVGRRLARLRDAVATSDGLQRLPSLHRVPSGRELQVELLQRVVALLVPVNGAWLAAVRAFRVAKRVLRWTFGTI